MSQAYAGRKRIRRSFGRIPKVLDMPNLIEVQKYSYDQFLQAEEPDGGREDMGLQAVFKSVFQSMISRKHLDWNLYLMNLNNRNMMLRNVNNVA